jgi:hypothetical protein
MHVTWGISKPACLPKASHHLLNICSVILFILVPCAFCTMAQPQLTTDETGCHLHWLDVIVSACMQASAVCTGVPVFIVTQESLVGRQASCYVHNQQFTKRWHSC